MNACQTFRSIVLGGTIVSCICALQCLSSGCNEEPLPVAMSKTNPNKAAGAGADSHTAAQAGASGSATMSSPNASAGSSGSGAPDAGTTMLATGAAGSANGASGSGSADAGTATAPANSVAACVAREGETVCDGVNLYHCGPMGSAKSMDMCASEARCRAGVTTGKCGICEPNDYRCTDKNLETCDSTGEWMTLMPCASPELCAQGLPKRSCDPMACTAGSYDCSGGVLRKCKDDMTDYDQGTPCEADLCDKTNGRCNECMPKMNTCDSTNTNVITCSDDGKKGMQACAAPTAFCTNGKCVGCRDTNDCPSPSACGTSMCDTGKGMCTTTNMQVHTACTNLGRPGRCDLLGNCVPCVDDTDCPASQQCNPLLGCTDRPPLQLGASIIPGLYSVAVAPGYQVAASGTGPDASSVTVSPGFGQTYPVPVTIPASATSTRTFTIAGPNAAACYNPLAQTSPTSITLSFEDTAPSSGSTTAPACDSATVTLTASK